MSPANDPGTTTKPGSSKKLLFLAGGTVLVVLFVLIIFIFVRPGSRNPSGTSTVDTQPQFTIQRLAPAVFMGEADPLPEVTANDAQPFPLNFLATTGQDGEAVIKGNVEGTSCSIFIFFNTRLERSACNKAASAGNATCLEEGSAVFENCHDHLVQTAAGEVKLLGTWASVTYLPDQKLTLLAVTEGETSVQPVVDDTNQTLGGPVTVGAGEYYYSAPDQEMNPVAGAPPRQAIPLDEISPLLAQYPQAAGWFAKAMERSKEYGVNPAQFIPAPTQTVVPTSSVTPTITPSPTTPPLELLVIPRPVQATFPEIDGYCADIGYGQGYLWRFSVGVDTLASGFLMQDDDWLYLCGTFPSGLPMAGKFSVFLDPQGDGNRYTFANQTDYQLSMDLSSGEAEILIGNGEQGYTVTDEHRQDWLSALAPTQGQQFLFEYAISLKGLEIGNCGQRFGLAFVQSGFPNDDNVYGWPAGVLANRPATWQPVVLEQPNCPESP